MFLSRKKIVPESDISLPSIPPQRLIERIRTITSLIQAADAIGLHRLIDHYGYDSDVETCGIGGATPLHEAAKYGDRKVMEVLLSCKKIDINKIEDRRSGGYTALHYASKRNHPHIVQLLIQNGADPNIKSLCSFSETPLHICCKNDLLECARNLILGGADVNSKDALAHNPSFWAYSKHYERMIKELSLPPPASPSASDFFANVICRNANPTSSFLTKKTKKKKTTGKKKQKKK